MKRSHILLFSCLTASLLAAALLSRSFESPPPFRFAQHRGPEFRLPAEGPPARRPRGAVKPDAAHAGRKQRPDTDKAPKVTHEPQQPTSGKPVLITVDFKGLSNAPPEVSLEYQVVEPG